MNLTRCPICHHDISLEALLSDEAGRELLTIITKLGYGCARPLTAYLGLFRTPKSNLSNARAVKLINEILALYQPSRHLAYALDQTVHSIHIKRSKGEDKPLKSHAYLKSVYESTKPLFAFVEHKEVDKPARSSDDEYFEQMYSMKADFTKLEKTIPGALAWYKKKTGVNYV
ncbi:hypothetical protein H3T61_00430 [Gilliamella sp. B14384H2]|uniref:hypothetical protein n=1 Tax=unclassified Gilliamella TaxID=2685620 RepID=UPI0018DB23F2|nr:MULTISPECIES: hypothetical protein [unclassified Gilliamella]MBI0036701.1 hypothetical protein [Gilliamella sp. B14384G10]MBI0040688.1 hypothetical protein [Gilliamella sp. B14384G7]MBI0050696.1 hypothetical protein [Gilliamella sp. B14384G13]MBI0052988.1 hypothetical protein [Gilliamella sp. B14384H2]